MLIDSAAFGADKIYHLLIQTVVPRPIAWVISDNGNGAYNLAPFSFFNAVASNPPILMISVGHKDDDSRKDTWVNIEARHDFVVHVPSGEHLPMVAASAEGLPHGHSEIDHLQLPLEKVEGQHLPRLKGPKVALFCTKYAIYEIGEDPQALILGKINHIWIDDSIITQTDGRWIINYAGLDPLARLGGSAYALLGQKLSSRK